MVSLFKDYFGFTAPDSYSSKDTVPDKYIALLRAFVGIPKERCDNMYQEMILHELYAFATQLLKYKTPAVIEPPHAPVDLWDLVPGNQIYLGKAPRLKLMYPIRGRADSVYYMFDFGGQRTMPWNLVVPSIVTAFCIARSDPEDLTDDEICYSLMKRGAQFYTVIPNVRTVDITLSPIHTPVLPADYLFTRRDYQNYVYLRDDLLRHTRRSRAALMRGGIIWRLSQSRTSEDSVIQGPTKYVTQAGISISFEDGTLHDDCLTIDELDAICGTYECLTGKGAQTVLKSWWPPYSIWNQYYDYEYWTDVMEIKFQERLKHLDSSEASPLTKQAWKKWLRGGGHSRDSKAAISNASINFYQSLLHANSH